MQNYIAELVAGIKAKNPAEPEFHQAVHEVVQSFACKIVKARFWIVALVSLLVVGSSFAIDLNGNGMSDRRELPQSSGLRIGNGT